MDREVMTSPPGLPAKGKSRTRTRAPLVYSRDPPSLGLVSIINYKRQGGELTSDEYPP